MVLGVFVDQEHRAVPYVKRYDTPSGLREGELYDMGISVFDRMVLGVPLDQGHRAAPYLKRYYTPSGLRCTECCWIRNPVFVALHNF